MGRGGGLRVETLGTTTQETVQLWSTTSISAAASDRANAARAEIPAAAPRALDERAQISYLRAVKASPSPRDQTGGLLGSARICWIEPALYDRIGKDYSATRRTDPRLAASIWEALASHARS